MFPLYYIHSDVLRGFKFSTTHHHLNPSMVTSHKKGVKENITNELVKIYAKWMMKVTFYLFWSVRFRIARKLKWNASRSDNINEYDVECIVSIWICLSINIRTQTSFPSDFLENLKHTLQSFTKIGMKCVPSSKYAETTPKLNESIWTGRDLQSLQLYEDINL